MTEISKPNDHGKHIAVLKRWIQWAPDDSEIGHAVKYLLGLVDLDGRTSPEDDA